ncbi:hypothetical protein EAG_15410 [Camponotus floridanus]|uniref:Uncharacterized protein n=1 Tax=Camponotus floridanus TaxID=104421 RepID=E2AW56_CAMFO|nr:hypothetical protein EAG_15410 [Camponotus floridanus]
MQRRDAVHEKKRFVARDTREPSNRRRKIAIALPTPHRDRTGYPLRLWRSISATKQKIMGTGKRTTRKNQQTAKILKNAIIQFFTVLSKKQTMKLQKNNLKRKRTSSEIRCTKLHRNLWPVVCSPRKMRRYHNSFLDLLAEDLRLNGRLALAQSCSHRWCQG